MNRRISDLLDNIQEDSIDLRESTPLSSDRIKELTMGKIEYNNKSKHKNAKTVKGIVSKFLIAAILICSLAVTASAAGYSSQVTTGARGQILDKDGNILKEVLLSNNIETVQGNTVMTDIVLLDDGSYIYIPEETEEAVISTDAEWWERFNALPPAQQAKISFRPNTESGGSQELFPQETAER